MGQQHNSHVYNSTDIKIKMVLIDDHRRETDAILDPEEVVCFPTINGSVTINVMRLGDTPDGDPPEPETCYTAPSDTSFIIKMKSERLVIVRAELGSPKKEEKGVKE